VRFAPLIILLIPLKPEVDVSESKKIGAPAGFTVASRRYATALSKDAFGTGCSTGESRIPLLHHRKEFTM
jgi:hypothetical protein